MADALWTWDDLVRAAGGVADGTPDNILTGFSLDTRSLQPGEVFVALKDQRDGHEFVSRAFAAGAAAAIVSKGYARQPGDGALLRVDETLKGLEGIARAARERIALQSRVIAVTGSAGKTGTKEMLRDCLSRCGSTHAPEKSFNNHWGVPLTLARMPATTQFAVFEIGMNHAGEITPLTRLARPHVAIVTNVLPVHVGNFADGESGVANAKSEIFLGLEPGGTAVVNRDNPYCARLRERAEARGARIVTFGRHEEADVRAVEVRLGETSSEIMARVHGRPLSYFLGVPGEHLLLNSLAVVAALDAVGADVVRAAGALASAKAPPGRGQRWTLHLPGGGAALLIDESYNANPASMRAALQTMAKLQRTPGDRRLAVLGDMLELGNAAVELHVALSDAIDAAGVDLVFASGRMMQHLFDSLPPARRTAWALDAEGLIGPVLAAVRPGDVVMVKGSNGSRSWRIGEALKKHFTATAA